MWLCHLTASFVPNCLTQKTPCSEAVIEDTSALAEPHTRCSLHKRTPLVGDRNLLQMKITMSIWKTEHNRDTALQLSSHNSHQVKNMKVGTKHTVRAFMFCRVPGESCLDKHPEEAPVRTPIFQEQCTKWVNVSPNTLLHFYAAPSSKCFFLWFQWRAWWHFSSCLPSIMGKGRKTIHSAYRIS